MMNFYRNKLYKYSLYSQYMTQQTIVFCTPVLIKFIYLYSIGV